jgi:hypothetical protein
MRDDRRQWNPSHCSIVALIHLSFSFAALRGSPPESYEAAVAALNWFVEVTGTGTTRIGA